MHEHTYGPWQRAYLRDGGLVFEHEDGAGRALEDGFFFVARPAALSLDAGDRFARSFYLPAAGTGDPYTGYRELTAERIGERQGYFARPADQTEQFFLESRHWGSVFPRELAVQAKRMQDFAVQVLDGVLQYLDIPRDLWDQATGGALARTGTYHLTFNHFRSQIEARGLNVHKDSGWVTVLRSVEPGLEVQRAGVWEPINAMPGWFIVNFGCSLEILTRGTATPVSAVPHRVRRQVSRPEGTADRFSYALFVDSSLDASVCPGLFRYERERGLVLETDFATFLDSIVQQTYEPDGVGLY